MDLAFAVRGNTDIYISAFGLVRQTSLRWIERLEMLVKCK